LGDAPARRGNAAAERHLDRRARGNDFSGFVLGSVVGRDMAVPSPAENRILRRALAAAEAQAHATPSIADLANAAAVSVRTLQEVFRTELGTTPAYLRSVRLRRVHEELVRRTAPAPPSKRSHTVGVSRVTDVSRRLYRTQYGMNPTATLRRGGRLSPAVRVARPGS
jgi:transcriptional regulator GlxA family with amidase domain